MIISNIRIPDNDIFKLLKDSHYKFYLTGSRYFRYDGLNSDWDFFTDSDQIDILKWLEKNNFKFENFNSNYKDTVFQRVEKENGVQVHIQVIHNAFIKEMIQKHISIALLRNMPKELHKDFWDTAIELFYAGFYYALKQKADFDNG